MQASSEALRIQLCGWVGTRVGKRYEVRSILVISYLWLFGMRRSDLYIIWCFCVGPWGCEFANTSTGQRGFATREWASQLGADGSSDAIGVDRRFLAGESSRMVLFHVPRPRSAARSVMKCACGDNRTSKHLQSLYHPSGTKDYRDLQFLKKLSAAALFGTLMSSSGLAYALALTWPLERCLMFMFQMVGVPLVAHAYLRTCLGCGCASQIRSFFLWPECC